MSTESEQIWTLHRSGIRGGDAGQLLHGCHIIFEGDSYKFTKPDTGVLSSTATSLTPAVPFTFPIFKFLDLEWAITVWRRPTGASMPGSWATPGDEGPDTGPQNGDFTAQTGGMIDTGKAASHAQASS